MKEAGVTVRDVADPGRREREALHAKDFAAFFYGMLSRNAVLRAAIITNKNNTSATVEPIAVVDFYAKPEEGTHDAQRLRRHP